MPSDFQVRHLKDARQKIDSADYAGSIASSREASSIVARRLHTVRWDHSVEVQIEQNQLKSALQVLSLKQPNVWRLRFCQPLITANVSQPR